MEKRLGLLAKIVLALLTLGGAESLYWLLFSLWMLAYPRANYQVWRVRFAIHLGVTLLIGACWTALLIWLLRQRRRSHRCSISADNGESTAAR